MKKVKMTIAAVIFCAATIAGSTAYDQATMTEQERLFRANLEALTDGEGYTASCDFSYTNKCVVICKSCGAEHNPEGLIYTDYKTPKDVTGACMSCGASY